ncbi:MAG: hypothetical protein GWO20_16120, partial [Candidatus Korarchaeota archaeon]|nr:hypothetical protein [Candidatus Korarchaeota archaeon]NIW13427.1 hypothetical protein [Candidatus Thorarchaeota archaeon]
MSFKKKRTTYFEKAGKENTDALLQLTREYVENEDLKDIVVASTTGETGQKASRIFREYNLVVVTHHFGFREPGKTELREEFRREILANEAKIFTGTH